ncbi:hypothetical protein [Maribellus maritimus]|uniref:hypothetical protein n=1 Tax=Maribellus maritimus TaxID=2870838 RepID=UPI001EEA01D1|nr:hypothetical protein [Maribellus maritimus]MCG6186291.1 hypothetical protein [Maribellus maritimus]
MSKIAKKLRILKMKHVNIFLTILISFYFYSCYDSENEFNLIDPSLTQIEMEGEGGETEILFTHSNWKIAGIINQNGDVKISGDSYSIDGSLIRENYTLKLDSLGRVDAFWTNKGFSIVRNSFTSLKVALKENSTGEDFNFTIVLESGNESKEIQVKQKKSQGYTFDRIEYKLDESDGDSIFVKQGTSFSFNLQSSQEFSFHPINGIGIDKTSFFKSAEYDAFAWTESDSILVEIPSGIENGKLYFNGDKTIYTATSIRNDSKYGNLQETVTIPSGNSKFSVEIQYRERNVSYALYLVNNRTEKEKIINGKWVEFAPTGNYTINRGN